MNLFARKNGGCKKSEGKIETVSNSISPMSGIGVEICILCVSEIQFRKKRLRRGVQRIEEMSC